jgi:predicted nucleic acid-binding protein
LTAIVSDATALIVLAKLGRLELLRHIFSGVIMPQTVHDEICAKADHDTTLWQDAFFSILPDPADSLQKHLEIILGSGESAALALAFSRGLPVLVDERKGRTLSRSIGIPVIGLAGVLLALVRKGSIDAATMVSILEDARAIGFRVSHRLLEELVRAGGGILPR